MLSNLPPGVSDSDDWFNPLDADAITERLEYLRSQIIAECISYGEIAELQDLAEYIDDGDVLLLQWAGVPEFEEEGDEEPDTV
jgi:hypothetical protein